MSGTDIAVIGVGCRFPDAESPAEYWSHIDAGAVAVRPQPVEGVPGSGTGAAQGHPDVVRVAATLPDAAAFASEFFEYPPAEAELIDPAHRLFLEVCWEALEYAGHPPRDGGPTVGVFAAGGTGGYSVALQVARAREHGVAAALDDLGLNLGGSVDFLASRVAYKLGLRGPSVAVQTACSSSLTAVHYAALSLLSGECDLALAGGAAVAEPLIGYRYTPGGILSRDGLCRAFDADSSGTATGSGVGVVVLRRLEDAVAGGDTVLAVLKGSAVGNDGRDRAGFTAPSPAGLAEVVAAALRVAGVRADQVRYVEAHGSGTPIGDRIELRGLIDGLRSCTDRELAAGSCGLGTVKANIGHAGWAAGIAGFIKAVHVARTGRLPPQPLFRRARDPGLLADSPLFVPVEAAPVAPGGSAVLVSSMGLGGVNAVAVLEPAPPAPVRATRAGTPQTVRLLVSARTRIELDAICRRLADALDASDLDLADVSYTLRVGRRAFAERRLLAGTPAQLVRALRLPRRPWAQTVRTEPTRVLVCVPEPATAAARDLATLLAGVLRRSRVVDGAPDRLARDEFALVLGAGADGPDRSVVRLDGHGAADPAVLDGALATAWLHGADVDWEALPTGRARRVPLPTYPFQRRRHWALDRLAEATGPSVRSTTARAERPPAVPAQRTTGPGADSVEDALSGIWRDLFGVPVDLDTEFGALGGTSLQSVKMALEVHQRLGVLVNIHRAGGSHATIRRLADTIRAAHAGAADPHGPADGDGPQLDRDLRLPLGPVAASPATGTDLLLTGATGFLGAFLLAALARTTTGRIHCLVRAGDATSAWQRLCRSATRYLLPAPDPDRVRPVPGDLRNLPDCLAAPAAGGLPATVGHVIHCAASVVFTEPYRALREPNVLAGVELLRWMRRHGVSYFSFVSSLAATGVTPGSRTTNEAREQPLDPAQGGYGVTKWAFERILERAESDGGLVRIFRPGLLSAATGTGACNPNDLLWRLLASGVAVGSHPLDERTVSIAPVDVVADAIAELAVRPGSVGRAYHLVDEAPVPVHRLFGMLGEVGLCTEGIPPDEWRELVLARARGGDDPLLASMALYGRESAQAPGGVQATAWQEWLARAGAVATPSGAGLRAGLEYLARTDPAYHRLLALSSQEQR